MQGWGGDAMRGVAPITEDSHTDTHAHGLLGDKAELFDLSNSKTTS